MIPQVQLLDEMDESTWQNLGKNLTGVSDPELDWRPHPNANSIRWIVGHLTWFEEWAGDALAGVGRYVTDDGPYAYIDEPFTVVCGRFEAARATYRGRIGTLAPPELDRRLSYLKRYEVSVLDLLKTHALHLAGHRFQIRYIRGTYSRAHGTRKTDFDPW
jgi:DinB superfamily